MDAGWKNVKPLTTRLLVFRGPIVKRIVKTQLQLWSSAKASPTKIVAAKANTATHLSVLF